DARARAALGPRESTDAFHTTHAEHLGESIVVGLEPALVEPNEAGRGSRGCLIGNVREHDDEAIELFGELAEDVERVGHAEHSAHRAVRARTERADELLIDAAPLQMVAEESGCVENAIPNRPELFEPHGWLGIVEGLVQETRHGPLQ